MCRMHNFPKGKNCVTQQISLAQRRCQALFRRAEPQPRGMGHCMQHGKDSPHEHGYEDETTYVWGVNASDLDYEVRLGVARASEVSSFSGGRIHINTVIMETPTPSDHRKSTLLYPLFPNTTMTEKFHILLLGGTGICGLIFAQAALDAGHKLTLYVRTPSKIPKELSSNANLAVIQGDLSDADGLKRAAACGADVFVSLAGPTLGRRDGTVCAQCPCYRNNY